VDFPQRSRARLDHAQSSGTIRGLSVSREPIYVGVELGGTKCVCLLARDPETILAETRVPTTTPDETLGRIEEILDAWYAEHGFHGVGIASFGPLELRRDAHNFGRITRTTKPDWANAAVGPRLMQRFDVPAAIDTDVSGAALAEGLWGGARGLCTYSYITVGTGIGAGIIVNGKPVMGLGHAEAGHMQVARYPGDDWPGACVFHGDCVEGLASGFAIEQRVGRSLGLLEAQDPVWHMVAHAIAGLCCNLVMTVVPQRILIGGGVVNRQPQLLGLVRDMVSEGLADYGDTSALTKRMNDYIVPPGLGDLAGPLGAIALAYGAHLSDASLVPVLA
jgi:fructokinase